MVDIDGLCSTCNNASTCINRRLRGSAAIFCEEFDTYVARAAENPGPRRTPGNPGWPPAGSNQRPPGLCATCDDLAVCALPRPEGGVWRCEEFC